MYLSVCLSVCQSVFSLAVQNLKIKESWIHYVKETSPSQTITHYLNILCTTCHSKSFIYLSK